MAQNFTTNVSQWQEVINEVVAGSKNLAESGGIDKAIKNFSDTQDALFMLTQLMEFKTTRNNSSASTYLSTGLLEAGEFYVIEFINNSNSDFHSSVLYISNGGNTTNYKVRDYLDIPVRDRYCVPIIPSVDTTYVNTNIQFVPEISVSVYKYPNKDYYNAVKLIEDSVDTKIKYSVGYRYFQGELPRVRNSNSACAEVECTAGDIFMVYGQSYNASRLWYFLDSSNNILEQGTGTDNKGFHVIVAPTNATKLLLNAAVAEPYAAYKASEKITSSSIVEIYKALSAINGEKSTIQTFMLFIKVIQ